MTDRPTPRRIEGTFSHGWPMALFITALAVGAYLTAGLIHRKTFRSPNDVSAPYRKGPSVVEGSDTSAHRAGGH